MLHGLCPNVMTLGEATGRGGFPDYRGIGKQAVEGQGVSTLLGDKRAHSWDP